MPYTRWRGGAYNLEVDAWSSDIEMHAVDEVRSKLHEAFAHSALAFLSGIILG